MTVAARRPWVVLSTLVLVAINLRTLITSVPTVELEIQQTTGWSDFAIGLLTTTPVIFMGATALIVPTVAGRIGRPQTVWLALAVLTIAAGMRWWGAVPGVMALSVTLAGIGIALAAGLVPGIVREQLPHAMGRSTGAWTATMFAGATIGAALTVPIASALGSWQAGLAFWAVPALIAFIVWAIVERPLQGFGGTVAARVKLSSLPWRSGVAWALTAYMAINSLVFYGAIAWIAPSLDERGYTAAESGWLFGLSAASQIVGGLILPPLTQRMPGRRIIWTITILITCTSLVIFALYPLFVTPLILVLFGMSNSGGFAISLGMLSEFVPDAAASARLTAMAFTVTYLVAALGPAVTGAILQVTNSWMLVFLVLAALALAQLPAIIPLRKGTVIA